MKQILAPSQARKSYEAKVVLDDVTLDALRRPHPDAEAARPHRVTYRNLTR